MTVPVAPMSARRTVRVAAALVAGQAVLCAVIGYVTLGGHGSGGSETAHAINPLAEGPLVLPAPAVPPPSSTTVAGVPPPQPAAVAAVKSTTTVRPPGSTPWHRPEVTPAPPAEAPPDVLVGPSGSATGASTQPATVPPAPPSPDATSPTSSSLPPLPASSPPPSSPPPSSPPPSSPPPSPPPPSPPASPPT